MKTRILPAVAALVLVSRIEMAGAVEFEALNKAVAASLGTTKASKKTVGASTVFYSKGADGKADKLAFVEKGIYQPNCTHTWVIGMDAKTGKVNGIRVVEMSCPHAFPTKAASFLDQYVGKAPADAATLSSKINTIAKATGSSNLTTDAVKRSFTAWSQLKGKI